MRTEFDRDYTRIINCNAYKRLKHKTQVFFSPQNDHICTRSEHVNLVESVSYSIANYFGLNTELTKAIAIAHDLGHSPFGAMCLCHSASVAVPVVVTINLEFIFFTRFQRQSGI